MTTLNKTLSNGGPDGAYKLQITAEGTLGFADLAQFGSPPHGFDYIGQVFHTTSGPAHYVDTINFNIKDGLKPWTPLEPTYALVRAFSTSQIGGALGDNGQNYKNIMTVMKKAFGFVDTPAGGKIFETVVDSSCHPSPIV